MGAVYSFVGIILGCIVAYIALRIFQLLFPFGIDEPALISAGGLLVSVLYSIVIILCMMVLAVTFMKRTNIIDVLK